jgi:hypothetical protein
VLCNKWFIVIHACSTQRPSATMLRRRQREGGRSLLTSIDDWRSVRTTPLAGDTAHGRSWPSTGGEYYTPILRLALWHAFRQHNRPRLRRGLGVATRGSWRAWRSRRSRIGIKFIDPMNRAYGVELPNYQNTESPKYQKSKVPNTLMRPYIFVARF